MITQTELLSRLEYCSSTGFFIRLPAKRVDKNLIGKRAGNIKTNGYREVAVRGKSYLEHRLAWFYMTGEWPSDDIDHINSNRSDNRWVNLREATRSENMQNMRGVFGCMHGGGYRSRIRVNGKTKNLGTFKTKEEAHNAYIAAKRKYHPRGEL